jgi:hypothetical protein
MKFYGVVFILSLTFAACSLQAQEGTESSIEIHNNVKLIEMPVPSNIPDELRSKYQAFLPLLVEALKEKTSEQAPENAITFRIVPGVKEVGSAKTKRVFAQITAYRRNTRSEYIGSLLLHSYATGGNVNKEEIGEFLSKQILSPLGIS